MGDARDHTYTKECIAFYSIFNVLRTGVCALRLILFPSLISILLACVCYPRLSISLSCFFQTLLSSLDSYPRYSIFSTYILVIIILSHLPLPFLSLPAPPSRTSSIYNAMPPIYSFSLLTFYCLCMTCTYSFHLITTPFY